MIARKYIYVKIVVLTLLLGAPGVFVIDVGVTELREAPREGKTLPTDKLDPAPFLVPGFAALGIFATELVKAINDFAIARRREGFRSLVAEDGKRLESLLRHLRHQLASDMRLPGSYQSQALARLDRAERAFWRCAEDPDKMEAAEGYLRSLEGYAADLSDYLQALPGSSYHHALEDLDEREER